MVPTQTLYNTNSTDPTFTLLSLWDTSRVNMAASKMNTSYNTGSSKQQLKTTNEHKLRIVLVGKTGVGKSATGNTILGKKVFQSRSSPSSITKNCSKEEGVVNGQSVAVIDTPGLFDTKLKEVAVKEIKTCIYLSVPGPHVFLVVLQIGRFTAEEHETVKIIQTTFGEEAANYSMVLFTHGDQLDTQSIEDYIRENDDLKSFVDQCKSRFHLFHNKKNYDPSQDADPSQVTELLEKINKMVEMNKGSHYTNKMFQVAERALRNNELIHKAVVYVGVSLALAATAGVAVAVAPASTAAAASAAAAATASAAVRMADPSVKQVVAKASGPVLVAANLYFIDTSAKLCTIQ